MSVFSNFVPRASAPSIPSKISHRAAPAYRRGIAWLCYAAALILALVTTPAQAQTYPCAIGPSQKASLHFVNAGDGSFQVIGLTNAELSAVPGTSCTGFTQNLTLRLKGAAVATVGTVWTGATTQGASLGHPASNAVTYQPPSASFSGTDTFALDIGNVVREIDITVIVDAPLPVANTFTASTVTYNAGGGSASSIDVAAHSSFGTSYAVGSATTSQGGSVSINSSGIASYTPPVGFRGNDSFTYTVTNSSGTSTAQTVTVPVGDPTLTIGLSSTTGPIGTALSGVTITASGGKAPYSCTAAPVTGALPAGVTLGTNCVLSGTPSAVGAATFTVKVTDSSTGTGPVSPTSANLIFTVGKATSATTLGSNNNPSVQGSSVTFTATVTGAGTPTGTMTFKDGATTLGTPTLSAGVATYSTTSLTIASHTITAVYSGDGNNLTSTSNSVTQVVNAPPAPIANAASASVTYNTAKALDLSGAITGGPHTSIAVVTGPLHGTTSVAGDVVTYTPTSGYFGSDSFTYTATGPGGTSPTATVTLTVGNPPAPTVTGTTASVTYDTAKAINLAGFISGVHTSIAIGTAPLHGTTSIAGDVVTYTPTSGYSGGDSFTYTATGPGGTSPSAATVTITVGTPPAPTVSAASVNITYNTAKAIDLSGSIGGGPHTSIAVASGPAHGTTSVAGDIVTYTPTSGYIGSDSFTYTATGPGGTSASAATVTLTVAAPPAPTVAAASASVTYNTAKAIDLSGSIGGGPHTSIAVASGPAHGTTSVAGDVVTYTPTSGYIGSDSFTYTATGPGGTSASAATVSLTVSVPPAPTVAAASATVNYETAKAIDLSGSIGGGPHTSIAVASGPAHGTTSVAGDIVTYTPTSGYIGSDSFTYTATGPGGTSASAATVTITVTAPAAPSVAAASASVTYNTAKAIDLSSAITGPHTSIAVASGPAHGTTSVAGDVVTYTPTSGYIGSDSFTYTATGPGGTSASAATVTLTVAAPAAPTVAATSASVAYQTAKAIDLAGSITGFHTSIAVASGPAHGTTSVSGDIITYTPASGYIGSDSFTYTATGPGGTSPSAATVTLTVAAPPAPTVAAAAASVTYDTAKAINLASAIGGGPHTSIAVASGPAHGTTSVSGDVITYTPTSGYFGSDSFTYTATGPGGTSASAATVTITVAAPAAPSVAAASAGVAYNTAHAIDLSASITGVHTSIAVASGPAHGTTSVAGDVVTYTPTAGYFGSDSFTYTATGPGGTSASAATVTITVGTPGAPGAAAASASITYNIAKAIDLSGSVSGVHTSIAVASGPAHGTTSVAGDVITYTPTSGYIGGDSFTYTASGPGGTSPAATVTLTVNAPPAPTVAALSAAVSYDTAKPIDLSGSIGGGPHTSIAVASGPAHGTTSVAGDVVTYTPTSGYIGGDSFTYTATGPGGTSASAATVTITVAAPSAPVAAAASASVAYDTAKAIDLSGSISGGPHTSIAIAAGPAHGTTSVAGNVVTYTPTSSYFGADSFTYTATGPGGTSPAATVTLTIAAPGAPTAAAMSASVAYDTAKAIDLSGSIGGVHSAIAVASGPAHGTTSVAGDVVTYTPTSGYYGADSFTYTATGPGGTSAAATVTLTIATPGAPVTAAASASVAYDTAEAIDLSGSISGVHTSIAVASGPAHGTTSVAGDVVTYTPTSGYYGADSFTYTATGPGGTSAAATVTLTIATPGAPVTAAASASVAFDTAQAINLASSISGVHASIAVASSPAHGTTSVAGDVVTFTPTSGYYGADSFTYTATGPGGTSAAATVTLTIATPGTPTAAAVSANVAFNTAKAINLSAAISGVHSAIAIASAAAHGSTSIAGDIVTYTPNSGYSGSDSFTYTATGPGGTSAAATVTLTVATPAAPVAAAAAANIAYDTAQAINLAGSISGTHGSIAIASAPAHGTTSIAGDVVTYTPTSGYFGADSFTYTATGPGGTSAAATVTLTIAGPAIPIAAAVAANIAYDTAQAINLAGSITGVHSAIAVAAAPTHGTTSIAGDVVTYTPTSGYFGADSFTYTATGPGGTSAAATVTLTVAPPAAPVAANVAADIAFDTATPVNLSASITGVHTAIAIASGPAHGTTGIAGDVVTFTPTSGYTGSDSFTYTATGPGGTSAAATATLTVLTPGTPVAATAAATIAYNSAGAINLAAAITGVHSSIAIVTGPAHGTTSIAGDVVTYTPTNGYVGGDSFSYNAIGAGGTSSTATVTITVTPPPPPVAGARQTSINLNTARAINLAGSISGVHSAIAIGSAPAHGTTSIAGDVVTYTPATGYLGPDSFTYTATGPGGTSAAATVSLIVAVLAPPVTIPLKTEAAAVPGNGSGSAPVATPIDVGGLVTGDYDTILIVSPPRHGTLSLSGSAPRAAARSSGALSAAIGITAVYTPDPGYVGEDSFDIVAVGPGGRSAPSTVSITVLAAPPVAQAKTATTIDGQMVSIDLTAGATNGPFTAARIVSVSPTDSATTAIVAGGTAAAPTYRLDVTPKPRFGGKILITYQLDNAGGTSPNATVTITVTARPDPSLDPTVRALSDAQAETARRFARTQVDNFMRRTEQLHGRGGHRSNMGARLALDALITGQMAPDRRSADRDHDFDILREERAKRAADLRAATNAVEAEEARNKAAAAAAASGSDGAPQTLAFWTGGSIQIGRRDGTSDRARMSISSSGLSGGADLQLTNNLIVGLGGGYGYDVTRLAKGAGRASGHDTVGAGYFSATPADDFFIDGVAGYGTLHFHTRRIVTETSDTAVADRDGKLGFSSLSAGIDRSGETLRWSLYGRGDYERATLDAYTETGAGIYDLRFGHRIVRSLTSVIGGRISLTRPTAGGTFTPWLRAEWSHEFADSTKQMVDYADIAGPALFGIDTQGWGREQFSLSIGNQLDINNWTLGAELGIRAAEKERSGTLRVTVGKKF